MASDFKIPEDVANRALQHIGAERIVAFTDSSKNAAETSFCYNKLRQSELRRNAWRFSLKRTILRPIDSDTKLWTPPTWSAVTTYALGAVIVYTDSYGTTNLWRNRLVSNLNNIPGATTGPYAAWSLYTDSIHAHLFDSTQEYYSGDLVYEQTAFATFVIYSCKTQFNAADPSVTEAWVSSQTYQLNDIVSYNGTNYISLSIENNNQTPGIATTYWATTGLTGSYEWLVVSGTLQEEPIIYPIGTGPADQTFTKNVYPLPLNYLGDAPQDPRGGTVSILGAPTNAQMNDWEIERGFIISQFNDPMFFRFRADVTDVTEFDPLFAEGLACRIALEVCETITQANEKKRDVASMYKTFMGEARIVNAVEIGPVEPPIDDYISTRL
jgi:hypothetical protein